jgi:lambda family phage portal protein
MAKRKSVVPQSGLAPMEGSPGIPRVLAFGGGLEGAENTSRETTLWFANRGSPDQLINSAKDEADARGREMVLNDGFVQGVVDLYRNSIVGNQYRLNSQPNWQVLSRIDPAFDEVWAAEYQEYVEETFNLIGESDSCWLDAARRLTFTGQIRMAIAGWGYTGEDLATAEWVRETDRPFNTAIQQVSPARLSNPDGRMDDATLRRGVRIDDRGKPLGYYIRVAEPGVFFNIDDARWTFVPAAKNLIPGAPPRWNRQMVLHTIDPVMPGQTRAVSEIVAVLKSMRMTKKFRDVVLQNAVINASYAATVESELPSDVVAAMLGGGQAVSDASAAVLGFYGDYLNTLRDFLKNANGVAIDGAKIPHLFPGTKLNAKNLGTPGGVGTEFEVSLLRHIAAGLGVSYEEFSNDFSRTNYSSGQLAGEKTRKHMTAKKKFIADRRANWEFALWLEEDLAAGNPPLPVGWDNSIFYEPYAKEALTACDWIGGGRGQIDELKETQAAMLRIKARLSTWEIELSRLGLDWRKVFRQIKRELDLADELELDPTDLNAQQNNQGVDTQGTLTDGTSGNEPNAEDEPPQTNFGAEIIAEFRKAVSEGWKPPEQTRRRAKEKTTVTKHDAQGRILEYVREEVE